MYFVTLIFVTVAMEINSGQSDCTGLVRGRNRYLEAFNDGWCVTNISCKFYNDALLTKWILPEVYQRMESINITILDADRKNLYQLATGKEEINATFKQSFTAKSSYIIDISSIQSSEDPYYGAFNTSIICTAPATIPTSTHSIKKTESTESAYKKESFSLVSMTSTRILTSTTKIQAQTELTEDARDDESVDPDKQTFFKAAATAAVVLILVLIVVILYGIWRKRRDLLMQVQTFDKNTEHPRGTEKIHLAHMSTNSDGEERGYEVLDDAKIDHRKNVYDDLRDTAEKEYEGLDEANIVRSKNVYEDLRDTVEKEYEGLDEAKIDRTKNVYDDLKELH